MRILVTGGSPGIGGACCRKLARDAIERGDRPRVAATELRPTPELDALLRDLEAEGAETLALYGDLRDPDVPAALVDGAVAGFGGLDAVVSNAGITSPAPLAELELEEWDRLFAVNTRASWLLARAAHPALKAAGGGFVAIASMSGMGPHPGMGAYSPSKAALISLCQTLAQEWAGDGIRVNTVSPGMIRTPLTREVYANNDIARERAGLVPWGRVGEPEDIANVVGFLLSPAAAYVTGQNMLVDGGFVGSLYGHIPGLPKSRM